MFEILLDRAVGRGQCPSSVITVLGMRGLQHGNNSPPARPANIDRKGNIIETYPGHQEKFLKGSDSDAIIVYGFKGLWGGGNMDIICNNPDPKRF